MQALTQIRRWWEAAKPVFAWLKAHARLAMAATLVLVAAIWLMEHDARLKQEADLEHLRREVTSEVAALRQKAEGSIEEARANQKAIRDLESRRTVLEGEAAALRSRLNLLREEDRLRVRSAITPGQLELAGSAASQPNSVGFVVRDSGFGPPPEGSGPQGGTRDSGLKIETGNWKLQTGPPSGVTGQSSVPAAHAARATTDPGFPIPNSGVAGGISKAQDLKSRIPEVRSHDGKVPVSNFQFPEPESQIPNPDLDNCREQVEVQDQLITNCEERAELNRQALEAAKRSALELDQALKAKDDMAARIDAQHRAELKAARGSRLRRFGRALQYVGVGVVIGMTVAR